MKYKPSGRGPNDTVSILKNISSGHAPLRRSNPYGVMIMRLSVRSTLTSAISLSQPPPCQMYFATTLSLETVLPGSMRPHNSNLTLAYSESWQLIKNEAQITIAHRNLTIVHSYNLSMNYLTFTTFLASQSITVINPVRETATGNLITQFCGITSNGQCNSQHIPNFL